MFNQVTFCIPVRIDSQERYFNLKSVVRFIQTSTYECSPLKIIEADVHSKIDANWLNSNLDYRFVHDCNPTFHRTHYINQMLSGVKTKYAAIWDTDIIIDPQQIYSALELIEDISGVMVLPHNGICHSVPRYISDYFRKTNSINALNAYKELMSLMNPYRVVGGAFIVDVKRYKLLGWENEHFIGWGPEDAERIRRLYILGERVRQIDGRMFHLHHPNTPIGVDEMEIAYTTKREFCRVCSLLPLELKAYIKTWPWIQ